MVVDISPRQVRINRTGCGVPKEHRDFAGGCSPARSIRPIFGGSSLISSRPWRFCPRALPSRVAVKRSAADCGVALWHVVRMVFGIAACLAVFSQNALALEFKVSPAKLVFERNFEQAQLLVTATDPAGAADARSEDLTSKATFASSNPAVVAVTPAGRLLGLSNGDAVVTVSVEGAARPVEVHVEGIVSEPKTEFEEQVLPILSKAGCNGGACHASQHGKGGFVLSVMGYDPPADRNAIVRDRMQRRVNLLDPADSLILKKPTMAMPHGGGRRLPVGSTDYNILASWIAAAAPEPRGDVRKLAKLII